MLYLFIALLLVAGSVVSLGVMTLLKGRKIVGVLLIIIGFVGLGVLFYLFNQPGVMDISNLPPNNY